MNVLPHAASVIEGPVLASLQSTLEEPLFPGKLVIWLLLMLSIIAWVSILSKSLQLIRSRRGDRRFLARLRKSREAMEVYEEGFEEEHSPHCHLYFAGVRETVRQLLGIKERVEGIGLRLRKADPLSESQARCLRLTLEGTCRRSIAELRSGLGTLRLIGAAALFAGLLGGFWSMMSGINRMGSPDELGGVLGTGLGFLVVSLFVAMPAVFGSLAFAILLERRETELLKFRDDLAFLFERRFGSRSASAATPSLQDPEDEDIMTRTETAASAERIADRGSDDASLDPPLEEALPPTRVETDPSSETVYHSGKKQYRSIRERLLADSDEDSDLSSEMNPIARQAAAMQKR